MILTINYTIDDENGEKVMPKFLIIIAATTCVESRKVEC